VRLLISKPAKRGELEQYCLPRVGGWPLTKLAFYSILSGVSEINPTHMKFFTPAGYVNTCATCRQFRATPKPTTFFVPPFTHQKYATPSGANLHRFWSNKSLTQFTFFSLWVAIAFYIKGRPHQCQFTMHKDGPRRIPMFPF